MRVAGNGNTSFFAASCIYCPLWRVRNSRVGLRMRLPPSSSPAVRLAASAARGAGWAHKFSERKAALRKLLKRTKGGIQYVEHVMGDGAEMFEAICKLGLEGIVSKKLDAPCRSGLSKSWLKTKNLKVPAATRVLDGSF